MLETRQDRNDGEVGGKSDADFVHADGVSAGSIALRYLAGHRINGIARPRIELVRRRTEQGDLLVPACE